MAGDTAGPLPLDSSTLPRLGEGGRVQAPSYDRADVSVGIVHLGVGGFHRSHEAMYLDTLMNAGLAHDWGIFGVGLLPGDRQMATVMADQDTLYTLLIKDPDGSMSARVIGSVVDYAFAPDDPGRVLDVMASDQVRIVSMTVTEAGYNVHRVTGEFLDEGPGVADDLAHPQQPRTMFGYVVEALARRRAAGVAPFSVVSCDNVQGNGHVARTAIVGFARLRDPELANWIESEVAFPNSMVDRITPSTTDDDRRIVRERFGIADEWPVVCEPFVTWVLEDAFSDGRPPLEHAGVQVVDDVAPYELMKLRLLNASHQALGYAGYLAGYRYVHEAMTDPALVHLLRHYMLEEAVPSLLAVPGVDLDDYVEQLIERFGNPAIADTLARLCVDSSERIPKFVLPVLRYQLDAGGPIDRAAAIVAFWARWAESVDEQDEPIEIVDPLSDVLTERARRQRSAPLAFVENQDIFGSLAEDERFAGTYERLLSSIVTKGAAATLNELADDSDSAE